MKNQSGSSKMDTILKMLLIAFVSLLAFSSGVYFGKQLSDSDYQLKALESDFNHGHAVADNERNPEDAIEEEEVNALSDKLVSSEKEDMDEADEHGAKDTHGEARNVASTEEHGAKEAHGGGAHAAPAKGHGEAKGTAHVTEDADEHEGGQADAHEAAPAKAVKGHGEEHGAKDAHGGAHGKEAMAVKGHAADHEGDEHEAAPAKKGHGASAAPAAHGHDADEADEHESKGAHGKVGANKPDLSAATKAAMRIAHDAAPTENAKPAPVSRVPSSLPKTVGTSQDVEFTVQVASYPTSEAAKQHADDLVKKGFPAFPVEATVNGKTWYRVSVGSFRSQREATTYRAQLMHQTNLPSAIVQRIQR